MHVTHMYIHKSVYIQTQSAFHMLRFESVDSTDCKLKKTIYKKKIFHKVPKSKT